MAAGSCRENCWCGSADCSRCWRSQPEPKTESEPTEDARLRPGGDPSYGTEDPVSPAAAGRGPSRSRRLLAEFLGTFVLCFSYGSCMEYADKSLSAGVAALGLVGCTYAFANISGANFNPAISLLLGITGKLDWDMATSYIMIQAIAGTAAGGLLLIFTSVESSTMGFPKATWLTGLTEGVYTTMLCVVHASVIYTRSNNRKGDENHFFGLAVGLVPLAGCYALGTDDPKYALTLNPAVSLSMGLSSIDEQRAWNWTAFHAITQFCASGGAALIVAMCRPAEFCVGAITWLEKHPLLMGCLAAEFVGTWAVAVTFTIGLVQNSSGTALAVGAAHAAMGYAFRDVSCHFNPATTLAVSLAGRRKMDNMRALSYMSAQFAAAAVAGVVAGLFHKVGDYTGILQGLRPAENYTWWGVMSAELLFGFVVVLTALVVLTARARQKLSSMAFLHGLAVGGAITAGQICAGAISGGVLNPAVAMSVTVEAWLCHPGKENPLRLTNLTWFLLFHTAAAFLATLAFTMLYPEEFVGPLSKGRPARHESEYWREDDPVSPASA